MPPIVDITKCNGCKGRSETFCEEICPGDLMAFNHKIGKVFLRSPRDCWDCMSCIKACPRNALEIKIPYQLGYYKASLKPVVGKNTVTWKCRDINDKETLFHFENRKRVP